VGNTGALLTGAGAGAGLVEPHATRATKGKITNTFFMMFL
jgi:hypothetical protein